MLQMNPQAFPLQVNVLHSNTSQPTLGQLRRKSIEKQQVRSNAPTIDEYGLPHSDDELGDSKHDETNRVPELISPPMCTTIASATSAGVRSNTSSSNLSTLDHLSHNAATSDLSNLSSPSQTHGSVLLSPMDSPSIKVTAIHPHTTPSKAAPAFYVENRLENVERNRALLSASSQLQQGKCLLAPSSPLLRINGSPRISRSRSARSSLTKAQGQELANALQQILHNNTNSSNRSTSGSALAPTLQPPALQSAQARSRNSSSSAAIPSLKLIGSGSATPEEVFPSMAPVSPRNNNKFGLKLKFTSTVDLSGAANPDESQIATENCKEKENQDKSNYSEYGAEAQANISKRLPGVGAQQENNFNLNSNGKVMMGGFQISDTGVVRTPTLKQRRSLAASVSLLKAIAAKSSSEITAAAVAPSDNSPPPSQSHRRNSAETPENLVQSVENNATSGENGSESEENSMGSTLRMQDLVKLGELGSGATGTVLKCLHLPDLRIIALKSISIFDPSQRAQMLKELNAFHTAKPQKSQQNPQERCQISFIGALFNEGKLSMGLEFCNRGSLDQIVRKYGPIKESALKHIFRQLIQGLEDIHARLQVHRDIKPANLLCHTTAKQELLAKISDFGLLKQLEDQESMCSTFVGSMMYLSPERVLGQSYSSTADIWGIGLCLVYCAQGQLNLPSDYWALLNMINLATVPKLSTADGFSADLCDFVARCLIIDPQKRATATQLLSHPWLHHSDQLLPAECWPFPLHTSINESELEFIVENVLKYHYSSQDLKYSAADEAKLQKLVDQLGCSLQTINSGFLKKVPLPALKLNTNNFLNISSSTANQHNISAQNPSHSANSTPASNTMTVPNVIQSAPVSPVCARVSLHRPSSRVPNSPNPASCTPPAHASSHINPVAAAAAISSPNPAGSVAPGPTNGAPAHSNLNKIALERLTWHRRRNSLRNLYDEDNTSDEDNDASPRISPYQLACAQRRARRSSYSASGNNSPRDSPKSSPRPVYLTSNSASPNSARRALNVSHQYNNSALVFDSSLIQPTGQSSKS
jgi:serine/threonine protein kinase